MKKHVILAVFVIVLIIGFLTGFYLYRIKIANNSENLEIAEKIEDECTYIAEYNSVEDLISANSKQEKISPNCKITFKIFYKKCGHIIEKEEEIDKSNVNLTEKELRSKFPNWEIQRFTPTEITMYCQMDDFCNEHYKIKEENGSVSVYQIDKDNNEKFLRKTDIELKFLEDEDLNKLKDGIIVTSKRELNEVLEDFE